MPLVKTNTIRFVQSNGERDFKVRVNVSNGGLFTIALPEDVQTALGETQVAAKNLNEVERLFNEKLREYADSNRLECRVICYQLGITATIMDEAEKRCILKRDDVHFSSGATLDIAAAVYLETCNTRADGSKHFEYKKVNSSIPEFLAPDQNHQPGGGGVRSVNRLEWTQTREDFFKSIGAGMRGLLIALNAAFKDGKTIQRLADSGQPLSLT